MLAPFVMMAMLQALQPAVRSIDKGAMSGVSVARHVTISDREAWAVLWREHAPDRPLPDVDFSREIVVGVFLGTRPSAGFGVEIVRCREEGPKLVVQYRETTPPRDAITAQVLGSPYHLAGCPKGAPTQTAPAPGSVVVFEKLTT